MANGKDTRPIVQWTTSGIKAEDTIEHPKRPKLMPINDKGGMGIPRSRVFPWLNEEKGTTKAGFLAECEAVYDALVEQVKTGVVQGTMGGEAVKLDKLPSGKPMPKFAETVEKVGTTLLAGMTYGVKLGHQTDMKDELLQQGTAEGWYKPGEKAKAAKKVKVNKVNTATLG